MSTAFTAALPLLERLKEELDKLDRATKEIAKAKDGAEKNQAVAVQSQATATAAIGAAKQMVKAQEGLIERLGQQQLAGLGEQELLLRVHAEEITKLTSDQIGRHLDSLKQAATAAQGLIDRLIKEQPPLLAAIGEQHQRSIGKQQEMLQKGILGLTDALHQQMQTELKLLRQALETLQKNTRQQHDEMSSVASQLQVVAGRVAAFAEVMNAAKFTTRLENIEKHQQEVLANVLAVNTATSSGYAKLDAALQRVSQEAAEATAQHRLSIREELAKLEATNQQRSTELQTDLLNMTSQFNQASKQQRLLQIIVIGGIVALGLIMKFL